MADYFAQYFHTAQEVNTFYKIKAYVNPGILKKEEKKKKIACAVLNYNCDLNLSLHFWIGNESENFW